jgi:hypothetical protein
LLKHKQLLALLAAVMQQRLLKTEYKKLEQLLTQELLLPQLHQILGGLIVAC